MKNTAGFVGSNGILSSHHSFVESQNVYFKLALDIFAQKFIMELELFCYPFKQNEPFINQIAKVRKAKFIIPKLSSPITNDGPLCLWATVAKKICILIHNSKKDDTHFL